MKKVFAIATILSFSFTSQAQIQPVHIFSGDLQSGTGTKQEIDRFAGKYSSEGEKQEFWLLIFYKKELI